MSINPNGVSAEPFNVVEDSDEVGLPFPIVGIGASSGGLDAFSSLLQELPEETGMAFILVQHLSPNHKSRLTELLGRKSTIPVEEVTDGLSVEMNHVYVIPPNTCMRIIEGSLRLEARPANREPNLPIDFFLKSLAEHQKHRAIAVILSGTASDGSQGVKVIKDNGGLTFAQDENSAQFNMMPRNAIATGCIDYVLSPQDIAKELVRFSKHPYVLPHPEQDSSLSSECLPQILSLLQKTSGVDFGNYKMSTLKRRILRRMMLNKTESFKTYHAFLVEHPKEVQILSQDVFITVTRFFRDPEIFEALGTEVFPELVGNGSSRPIRIWVAGSSTGEEVYSLAISLLEFGQDRANLNLQIFATDIKDSSVEFARQGIYSESIKEDVSEARLKKFFTKVDAGYQVNKSIREMCIFAKQNITADPPFSKMDLISCRNVLIYLDTASQKKVYPIFHYALNPGGFLLLGKSENIAFSTNLFNVKNKSARIYSKNTAQKTPPIILGSENSIQSRLEVHKSSLRPLRNPDIQREADRITIKKYKHAGVVVNEALDVIQFRGDTSNFIKHSPGTASLNLLKMVDDQLRIELRNAVKKAVAEDIPVKTKPLSVKHSGTRSCVILDIVPFTVPPTNGRYFLIIFEEDVPVSSKFHHSDGKEARELLPNLEAELDSLRSHLQGTIDAKEAANEELQVANEEIVSSNEELQSLNEEFQSANEELESAKEELQATNEEIMTLNEELQKRNMDLTELNNDHTNLMNSTNIPVIMIDRDLCLRRFTPAAETAFRLTPEYQGTPITDLSFFKSYDLEADTLKVIREVRAREKEVQDNGRWYKTQVSPYRIEGGLIDGAVISFHDISESKKYEASIKASAAYRDAIIQTIHNPLIVLDSKLRVTFANRSFYITFHMDAEHTVNHFLYDLGDGRWNIPNLKTLFDEILPKHKIIHDYVIQQDFPLCGPKILLLNARKVRGEEEQELILITLEDITERREGEEKIKRYSAELLRSNEALEHFASIAAHDLREPLHIISSYAALLKQSYKDILDDTATQFLNAIYESGQKMQVFVRELLAYSQVGAEPIFEEVDMAKVCKQAVTNLEKAVKSSGAKITWDPLPNLMANGALLTQLFQNLISNALKFRRPDVPPEVRISVENKNGHWIFTVRDNGIGIANEHHQKIFEMFKRLNGKKEYAGSGIGLALCKRIVEYHRGEISLESEFGQGSAFHVSLPEHKK